MVGGEALRHGAADADATSRRAHPRGACSLQRGQRFPSGATHFLLRVNRALFTHGCSVSLPVHFSRGESCHGAHMLGLIPVLPTPRAGWFTACSPTAVWLSSAAPLPRGPFGFRALHPTTRPHTGTHMRGGPQITVVYGLRHPGPITVPFRWRASHPSITTDTETLKREYIFFVVAYYNRLQKQLRAALSVVRPVVDFHRT